MQSGLYIVERDVLLGSELYKTWNGIEFEDELDFKHGNEGSYIGI